MAFMPVGNYLPASLFAGMIAQAREGDAAGQGSAASETATAAGGESDQSASGAQTASSAEKVELTATFYTASLPARYAEKYVWEETSFEWTYTMHFYDKAAYEAGEGYSAERFSLTLCAYPSDVYLDPDAQVLGDISIGSYCYALLMDIPYEEGTAEYEEAQEDAAEVAIRAKWQDEKEITWRTSFSWPDVYRQFVNGSYFTTTDPYGGAITYYNDMDYELSLYDMDKDAVPELIITNGTYGETTRCSYIYTCNGGTLKYVGQGPANSFRTDRYDYPGLIGYWRSGAELQSYTYWGKNGDSLERTDMRRIEADAAGNETVTELTDNEELLALLEMDLDELESWSHQTILEEGWNAFLKDMGYGIYKCDAEMEYTTEILPVEPDLSTLDRAERKYITEAQKLYDSVMEGYSSVNHYIDRVRTDRDSYLETLGHAANYNVAYKYLFDCSKFLLTCVVGIASSNVETVYSVFSDIVLETYYDNTLKGANEALVDNLLEMMQIDLPKMNTEQFVYSQAQASARLISLDNLRQAMQKAERRGGKFYTAEDALAFIFLYQTNQMGLAGLRMGKNYYLGQLRKPSWQIAAELVLSVAFSSALGAITKADILTAHAQGSLLDYMGGKLDGLIGQYTNEHVITYWDTMKAIANQTQEMLRTPTYEGSIREDALIRFTDRYAEQTYGPEVAEVQEGFTFCHDFVIPEYMDPQVAADYLEIVEERINRYGMEHMQTYYGVYYGFKAGLSGGYLADLNQDGTPEMILVYRDGGGSYQEPTEAQYEFWTWEDGNTFEMFSGELERISPGGENESSEFINIWLGQSGTYLEMGYAPDMYQDINPETDATERWFMTYDTDDVFYRMQTNPANEDLILRIPVAAGNQIHLANCQALLDYLAETASGIAKTDPAAALEALTYFGDPQNCQMSGRMATAYALNLLQEPPFNPETTDASFLQAALVDVSGDGIPFMIKTVPHVLPGYFDEAFGHFIGDAMFCYYEGGQVKEYSFLNDAKTVTTLGEYPPQIYVSYLDSAARGEGVGILKVTIFGVHVDTQESATEEMFYFEKNGKLELFHRLTTVYGNPDDYYYWDETLTMDPEGDLRDAGLDNEDQAKPLYSMNYADQYADSYTSATATARMLLGYASTQVWEKTESGRDYSNWARGKGTIRSVELAYLCAFTNDACTKSSTDAMVDYMFEQLKNYPSDHPLHTDDDSSKSNLKKSQITAIRSGTNGSMEAIVIKLSGKRAIVIFGGTMGHEADDILTDMGIAGNSIPILGNLGSVLQAINPVSWFFEDQFEAASKVISDLEKEGYSTIFVAGHSLGGHIAVDVALNHDGIVECMAFDPPGRSDTAWQKAFNSNAVWKITTYKAIGSIVSMVGTQLGYQVKDLPVEENWAGPFPNHDMTKIAEALGGWDEVSEK